MLSRETHTFPPALPEGRPFDVVGLGGNACDHLIRVPHTPEHGAKTKFLCYERQGGGRTATAMVAVARLGHRSRYIGGVGDDAEGRANIDELAAEGVDVSCVRVRPGGLTQRAFILVDDATGERTIIWGRSEGMPISPEEVDASQIESGRLFYTDGQDPRSAAVAARIARAAGMRVLADLEDVRPGLDDLLPGIDILIASSAFPRLATGEEDIARGMAILEDRTEGGLVIVTLGMRGAAVRIDRMVETFPAYEIRPVDTTGAGDAFHAAFSVACLRGMGLREAIDFSNAVAAMKCLAPGGRRGIPHSVEQVERFRRATAHRVD
jgi:sugar/nucleoside kinase (ribokinase family)